MIVPEYWAEARQQQRIQGRKVTVRRYGWSDSSQAEAEANASARVQEALARIAAGETLHRREHKVAYNGGEGLPIREQVLSRHDDSVITRNSYGARCLNTPDVLFADIDFAAAPAARWRRQGWIVAILLVSALCWYAGYGFDHSLHLGRLGLALLLGLPLALAISSVVARGLQRLALARAGGPELLARQRIDSFLVTHPDWHLRLYRTPAGLRLLAMHRTFDPCEEAVTEFFRHIGSDPIFERMCRNQRCFRARLSPKPWRIGMEDRLRPRPGIWPVKSEHIPQRAAWAERYERKARDYAACRFVETLGSATVHPAALRIQTLHDEHSRALVNAPIA